MGRYIDLTGQVFGRLTVTEFAGINKRGEAEWTCKCECGTETIVISNVLSRGATKSCGCLLREVSGDRYKKPVGVAAFNSVLRAYKRGAKISGREFSLSKEESLELSQQNCFYCDSAPSNKLIRKYGNGEFIYNGVDRVDNNKGYTVDNCVPCCKKCNFAKKAMSQEEFIDLANRIVENTKRRKG